MKKLFVLLVILGLGLPLTGFTPMGMGHLLKVTVKRPDGTAAAGVHLVLYRYERGTEPSHQRILRSMRADANGAANFGIVLPDVSDPLDYINYAIRGVDPRTGAVVVYHFVVNKYTDFARLGDLKLTMISSSSPSTSSINASGACDLQTDPIYDGYTRTGPTWTTIGELHSTAKQSTQFTFNYGSQLGVQVGVKQTYPTEGSWHVAGWGGTATGGSRSTGQRTYGDTSSRSGQAVQTQFYYNQEHWHTESADVPGVVCQRWDEMQVGAWYAGLNLVSIPSTEPSYDNDWLRGSTGQYGPPESLRGGTTGTVTNQHFYGFQAGFELLQAAAPATGLVVNAQIQYTTASTLEWWNYAPGNQNDYYEWYVNYPGPNGSRTNGNDATMYYWAHSTP